MKDKRSATTTEIFIVVRNHDKLHIYEYFTLVLSNTKAKEDNAPKSK